MKLGKKKKLGKYRRWKHKKNEEVAGMKQEESRNEKGRIFSLSLSLSFFLSFRSLFLVLFVLNIFLFLFLFFLAVVHSLSSLSSLRSTSLRVAGVFLTFLPSSSYFPSLSWFLIVFFSSSFQHVPFRSDSSSASVLFAECEDVAKDLTDRRRPSTSISTQLPSWWSTLRLHYAIKNHFSPFQFHRTTIKPSKTQ